MGVEGVEGATVGTGSAPGDDGAVILERAAEYSGPIVLMLMQDSLSVLSGISILTLSMPSSAKRSEAPLGVRLSALSVLSVDISDVE